MAIALRVASVPRFTTASRPRTGRPDVVRAGLWNDHAGTTTHVSTPYGDKELSRRIKPCRATLDDGAASTEQALKQAAEAVGETGRSPSSPVEMHVPEMGDATKDNTKGASNLANVGTTEVGDKAKEGWSNVSDAATEVGNAAGDAAGETKSTMQKVADATKSAMQKAVDAVKSAVGLDKKK
ncbi:hypothetical protein FOA52_003238 [Chlamydomonas sp. UWO 241]|nr:hypothetical protein FOA52_003238 [Chlamydomonas sp. UWO 241]